jgi:hypothetical protein
MNSMKLDNPVLENLAQTARQIRKTPPSNMVEMAHAIGVFGAALEQLANWAENATPSLKARPRPAALDQLNTICDGLASRFEAEAITISFFMTSMEAIVTCAQNLDRWAKEMRVDACERADNVIAFPLKQAWPASTQREFGPSNGGDAA